MGSAPSNVNVTSTINIKDSQKANQPKESKTKQKQIDVDVIETANIALAIKHKEHITNLQITLAITRLPPTKAFQEMHTMVVLFKNVQAEQVQVGKKQSISTDPNPKLLKQAQNKQVQIGRTQIISIDPNPKFLTSFIVPLCSEKPDEIQFKVYNCRQLQSSLLADQTVVGHTTQKLQALNESENNDIILETTDPNVKEKPILKISCCEYDGANLKYEILLQAIQFQGKLQMYYTIQILKDSQLVPVARSNSAQYKIHKDENKTNKSESKKAIFDLLKVAASKFPNQDNTRIRIRLYDADLHEQIGSTYEMTLQILMNEQDKGNPERKFRVYKNGFVVGNICIEKWKKVNKDSFITYIVNGARLHLILGIDFTISNQKGKSLHNDNDQLNPYIKAIRQIVGMLQYFDYFNQIALYGFGAKLPPYYKCVGQCFALNGNYYSPLITGGVDEIIKSYKENLKKVKGHGPTKLSEMINMAIQFAQSEYQSSNYYVLIILTDGCFDDFDLVVEKIVEASSLPLSIVLVGLGQGQFSDLQKLDQDDNCFLKTASTNKICERDMIDFINFKQYDGVEKNAMAETKLARKTFSEIPSQFVDYMQGKGIKPNKEKKSLKSAKSQFITQKIKEGKNSPPIIPEVDFLKDQRRKMKKDLISLGFVADQLLEKTLNMPVNDLNYFIELYASARPPPKVQKESDVEIIASWQQKRFEEHLQRNEDLHSRRIQNELLKRQINQAGRRKKVAEKAVQLVRKEKPKLVHPCLNCHQNQICMLYTECGHLALCQSCCTNICILCKEYNENFINVNDYEL